jgi:hypothetical protein
LKNRGADARTLPSVLELLEGQRCMEEVRRKMGSILGTGPYHGNRP